MSETRKTRLLAAVVLALALPAAAGALGGSGAVALQSCDVSCGDETTHFYVGCDNGTVTDNRTGLVWLANADCFGELGWDEAMAVVSGLGDIPAHACGQMEPDACDCGLDDHSAPGEWRLPTMAEWMAMMSTGWDYDSCTPAIANDVGNGCWDPTCVDTAMCTFYGVQASSYWSSSTYVPDLAYAWVGDLDVAAVMPQARDGIAHVWPVRGGQ